MAEQESGGEASEERSERFAISRIESNLVARGAISPERFSVDVLRRIIDGSQFAGTNRSNVSADVRALRACTERLIQRAEIYRVCVCWRARIKITHLRSRRRSRRVNWFRESIPGERERVDEHARMRR